MKKITLLLYSIGMYVIGATPLIGALQAGDLYLSIVGIVFIACGFILFAKFIRGRKRQLEKETAKEMMARANQGDKEAEEWLYSHGYEPLEE